jgi:hypothetical protein
MTELNPDTCSTTEPLAFGETRYKSCDHCRQPVAIAPLLSGNPIGGALWSDGYMDAPQLPEQELLGKCAHCGEILCLPEQQDAPGPGAIGHASDHAFEPLTLDDFRLLLDHIDQIDTSHHLYVRLKCWQLGNHPRRQAESGRPLSDSETENLQQLLLLLGDDEADRLLKAEVFRQLGDFKRAENALVGPFHGQAGDIVSRLRELVRRRQSQVAQVLR